MRKSFTHSGPSRRIEHIMPVSVISRNGRKSGPWAGTSRASCSASRNGAAPARWSCLRKIETQCDWGRSQASIAAPSPTVMTASPIRIISWPSSVE